MALFEISDYQDSDEEIRINNFTVESAFTNGNFWNHTSMKESNAGVQLSEWIRNNRKFLGCLDYQDASARINLKSF